MMSIPGLHLLRLSILTHHERSEEQAYKLGIYFPVYMSAALERAAGLTDSFGHAAR